MINIEKWKILALALLLMVAQSHSQSNLDKIDWVPGKVNTGEVILTGGIAVDATTREGALLLKTSEGIKTYPPDKVASFFFVDDRKGAADTVFFESIQTQYADKRTDKKSFQRVVKKGYYYSLYKSYVPEKKAAGFILPMSGWLVVGLFTFVESEEVVFLAKNGTAFQISRTRNILEEESYNSTPKIDKEAFYEVVGNHAEQVNDYIRTNKLKLRKVEDIEGIVGYLNTLMN